MPDAIVFELCQSMKGFRLVDIPLEFVCELNWFNRANRGSGATERITYFLYQFLLRLSAVAIIDVQLDIYVRIINVTKGVHGHSTPFVELGITNGSSNTHTRRFVQRVIDVPGTKKHIF